GPLPHQAEKRGDPEGSDDRARAAIHPAESLGSERRPEHPAPPPQDEPPERRAEKDTEHHYRGGAVGADASPKTKGGEDGREGDDGGGGGEGGGEGEGAGPAGARASARRGSLPTPRAPRPSGGAPQDRRKSRRRPPAATHA